MCDSYETTEINYAFLGQTNKQKQQQKKQFYILDCGSASTYPNFSFFLKALKRVGKSVNIQEVMDQWTLQMGYPVITILGNETTDNVIVISQERFVYDSDTKTKDSGLGDNRYLFFSMNIFQESVVVSMLLCVFL